MRIKIIIIIHITYTQRAHTLAQKKNDKFAKHCYAKFICPRSHLLVALLLLLLLLTSSEVRLKRNFRFRKMAVNAWSGNGERKMEAEAT